MRSWGKADELLTTGIHDEPKRPGWGAEVMRTTRRNRAVSKMTRVVPVRSG
jgi:hypothetical protein